MSARQQHQKMRIRAFPAAMPGEFTDNTWGMLQTALNEILHKNNSGLSFEELYRNAYTMVLHKKGEVLYNGLTEVVTEHLRNTICPEVTRSLQNNFLETLNKNLVGSHDRDGDDPRHSHVSQARLDPVYNLGLQLFRNEIIAEQTINGQLKATLLSMIAQERAKEAIEWIDLKNACQMLFESLFLNESTEFYRKASQKFLQENSASVYIRKVNECLEEEQQRSKRYLDEITEEKIIAVLKEELITRHMQTVVEMENSGMVFMLTNERVQDLRELYELLKLVPDGPSIMTAQMSRVLRERGTALVTAAESTQNPIQYIQNLLDLKDQYDKFLEESFLNDKEFKKTIQTDFEFFFNFNPTPNSQPHSKSAEYLSLYIDDKLKKGLKDAMILFKFLEDKDLFESHYKKNLAKRFLFNRSISDDAEKGDDREAEDGMRLPYGGRKIALNPALGTADLKATFFGQLAMDQTSQEESAGPSAAAAPAARRKEENKILMVSTFQMVVLDAVQLERTDHVREPSDAFFVNDAFTSKLHRIRVQMVSARGETDPERRETLKKVEDDRKHEIEAAIVRVMKARKALIHNDLITEVTQQLNSRFNPDPILIKKRIESLIEREYLKRDQETHRKYHYLA
ncbi:CULLIN-2 domain-containing protein [Aphelenchoides fujianensis]|nr:CULLIN-2 domain-containing protein [Aphelenchoides fujianensis]